MLNKVINYIGYLRQELLKQRLRPKVIQLPITGRCNSRCVTCKVWNTSANNDLDASALKMAFQDRFFSKVEVVGINGGEPSLYKDINGLLDAISVLAHLRRLHFISNGLLSNHLLPMMETVKTYASQRGIQIYLTVSIDGYRGIHDTVRGLQGAFEKTISTIIQLKENKEKYCDVLDIGSTISNANVDYVPQTEKFIEHLGIDAYYHPAVPNKRLHNFRDAKFDIRHNIRSSQLTAEYFYSRYKKVKGVKHKLRSFLIFDYLRNGGTERLAGCQYRRGDVTISENLDLFLCATASDKIGNLKEFTATELLESGKFKQREYEVGKYCNTCVHYIVFPSPKGTYKFVRQLLSPYVWIHYKLKSLCLK